MPFDIIADEHIDPQILGALKAAGHSVFSIWDAHRGISDRKILELAFSHSKLILTEDKDFGEYVFSHKLRTAGVIFLRYEYPNLKDIIPILIRFLERPHSDLFGKFAVITVKKIRIREL